MKRLLLVVFVTVLCVVMVACGASEQTPTTTRSTSATAQGTTTSSTATTLTTTASTTEAPPTSTVATVVATTTISSKSSKTQWTSRTRLMTTSPTFANGEVGELLTKLPWTAPPHVPFYGTESEPYTQLIKILFSTREYNFWGNHISSAILVFDDGSQHKGSELEELLSNGKITIDDVVTLFDVEPIASSAIDVVTGEMRLGEMSSYRRRREATVRQGHAEVHIYPPFDFFGEFFKDDRRTDSVGYYLNAAYLDQIIGAACPSVGTLDTAEAIRVGDSLFVPLSAAEKLGITVNVGEKGDPFSLDTPSLQIVLPNA